MAKDKKQEKETKGSGEYLVDSKTFASAMMKCMGIISLGERADSNVLTLNFTKKGLAIEAVNSVASFRTELPVKVISPTNRRVSIIPEALQAYSKSYKELTLKPNSDRLDVSSGKTFSAKVFYVGSPDDLDIREQDSSEDISKVASVANDILGLVSGMRNRTDQQPLGVLLGWGNNKLELTVGDTHHAIIVDAKVKHKKETVVTTTLPNLQKIMSVGNKFAATDDMFFAWSETEYLSIANKTDNMFLADTARGAIKDGKKKTSVSVSTAKFREMVDTLTGAIEETAVFTMRIMKGKLLGSISTGSGSARALIKNEDFDGKEVEIGVSVHHLRDCLSAMKEKTITIVSMGNMLTFEGKSEKMRIISAMTAMG